MKGMSTREKNLLFYDGDCGLCQASVDWLQVRDTSSMVSFFPYQDPSVAEKFPQIDLEHRDLGVQFLTPGGQIFKDEQGIAACLRYIPGWKWLGGLIRFPLFRPFAHLGYRLVAHNRAFISRFLGLQACKLHPLSK